MRRHGTLLMLASVLLLVAGPLLLIRKPKPGPDGSAIALFTGSDDQAKAAVAGLAPAYHPWAHPLLVPPSSEVESLLFALQAALGAGFIGYHFGTLRSRPR